MMALLFHQDLRINWEYPGGARAESKKELLVIENGRMVLSITTNYRVTVRLLAKITSSNITKYSIYFYNY